MIEGDKLLKLPDVLEKVPLSPPTIYSLMGKGLFPKQVKIGLGRSFWLESEITAWLDEQIAARRKRNKT